VRSKLRGKNSLPVLRNVNEVTDIGEKKSKLVEGIRIEALRKKGNLFLSFYHFRNYYKLACDI